MNCRSGSQAGIATDTVQQVQDLDRKQKNDIDCWPVATELDAQQYQ